MGRVECVTCHVSVSHAIEGFLKSVEAVAGEKVGGRRDIEVMIGEVTVVVNVDDIHSR
jgi:hypothetical protein